MLAFTFKNPHGLLLHSFSLAVGRAPQRMWLLFIAELPFNCASSEGGILFLIGSNEDEGLFEMETNLSSSSSMETNLSSSSSFELEYPTIAQVFSVVFF
jgi:hypothetical protein